MGIIMNELIYAVDHCTESNSPKRKVNYFVIQSVVFDKIYFCLNEP